MQAKKNKITACIACFGTQTQALIGFKSEKCTISQPGSSVTSDNISHNISPFSNATGFVT